MKKKIFGLVTIVLLGCLGVLPIHTSQTEEEPQQEKTLFEKGKEFAGKYGPKIIQAGQMVLSEEETPTKPSDEAEVEEEPTYALQTPDLSASSDLLGLDDFGAVNIQTGDIALGDITVKVVEIDNTSCNQNVVTACRGKGAVCSVNIGPCKQTVQQQPQVNAAPMNLIFSRFLRSNQHAKVSAIPRSKVPLYLTKQNNFTQIIETTAIDNNGQKRTVSYMILLLPTNPTFVDKIKDLPKGLARYLKSEKDSQDMIAKVYKKIGDSTEWIEIADQSININYSRDMKFPIRQIIGDVKIGLDGSLVVTYHNIPGPEGNIIRDLQITYQPF